MKNVYNQNLKINSNQKDNLVEYEYKESFTYSITKYENFEKRYAEESVAAEYPLTLILNDKVLNTFFCNPYNLEDMVIGNLFYDGKISSIDDILKLDIDKKSRVAKVTINENDPFNEKIFINDVSYITSKNIDNNNIKIDLKTAYEFMSSHLNSSRLFHETSGVHCACIYDVKTNKSIVIREDTARHNALDKAIGYCIKNNISMSDKVLFMSSRISFNMAAKVAKAQIPIIIAKSAPTNLAIDLCHKLNITLTGFVRGKKINIYTNPDRIIPE